MGECLFSAGEAKDPTYVSLRDVTGELAQPARVFAESLWGRFHGFADPHFQTEIRSDFRARFWEMYLTCTLLRVAEEHDFELSCPKPGPDILLEREGRRVWVEAVVATKGEDGCTDSVGEFKSGDPIPDEKLVLRYTNAISTKHSKYQSYLASGIIKENDSFVVAINGAALGEWGWAANDLPRWLKAVYPLGTYNLLLDSQTLEVVGQQPSSRYTIVKASKAEVSTMSFLEENYQGISAILHSSTSVLSYEDVLGFDFELALNPMGRAPIGDSVIPAKKVWRAVLNDAGGELTSHVLT